MMMGGMESILLVLLLGMGGTQGDMLDHTSTPAYWEAEKQKVVSVESMAAVLKDKNAKPDKKLMAIRTLGELGKADKTLAPAVTKLLTPLTTSKEPFEAEYAKRSIAWATGAKPPARAQASRDDLAKDLALIPETATMIAQARMDNPAGPVDWGTLLPKLNQPGAPDTKAFIKEVNEGLLEALGYAGNVRVDAITFAVDMAMEDMSFTLVLRGEFDRIGVMLAVERLIKEEAEIKKDNVSFYSIGKIEVISIKAEHGTAALLMPSNNVAVLLMGGGTNSRRRCEAAADRRDRRAD